MFAVWCLLCCVVVCCLFCVARCAWFVVGCVLSRRLLLVVFRCVDCCVCFLMCVYGVMANVRDLLFVGCSLL